MSQQILWGDPPGRTSPYLEIRILDFHLMFYWFRFLWIASRGYRLRPWKSPYLRWRIETFSGIPAEEIDFSMFWRFLWSGRRELVAFLRWSNQMQRQYGMK